MKTSMSGNIKRINSMKAGAKRQMAIKNVTKMKASPTSKSKAPKGGNQIGTLKASFSSKGRPMKNKAVMPSMKKTKATSIGRI